MVNHKLCMNEAFAVQKIVLTLTCTWPHENETFYYKLSFKLFTIVFFLYGTQLLMEVAMNLKNAINLTSLLIMTMLLISCLFKVVFFAINRDRFVEMVELLNEDIFHDHDKKLNVHIRNAIKLSKLLLAIFGSGLFLFNIIYVVMPFITWAQYPTPLSMDFGRYAPLIFAIQVIGSFYYSMNDAGIDYLCISMIILGAAQFDILKRKIIAIQTKESNETGYDVTKTAKNIVQHHQALIK